MFVVHIHYKLPFRKHLFRLLQSNLKQNNVLKNDVYKPWQNLNLKFKLGLQMVSSIMLQVELKVKKGYFVCIYKISYIITL